MSRTRFPYLTRAIKEAPVIEIPRVDGKGTYKFRVYSFGEAGAMISHELIREISRGLAKSVSKYFPGFDLAVGIDIEGINWAHMATYDLYELYGLNKSYTGFWSTRGYNPDFIRALKKSGKYGFVEVSSPFEKETLSYNRDAFKPNEKVLVFDDIVSEGRTLDAVFNVLINELCCRVVGAQVILAKSDGYKRVEDRWGVQIRFLKKSRNNSVVP